MPRIDKAPDGIAPGSAFRAAVAGGVNVDICGRPDRALIPADSNPGRVRLSLGGVGRNIAHNLALLGVDTGLAAALGDDLFSRRIADSCAELGIDLSMAVHVPGGNTSTYLYITDAEGEMALAVSDMDICSRLTPEALESSLGRLREAEVIVLDANIPEESIRWLCECPGVPVFADPVSVTKAEKLRGALGKLHTIKPNRAEAELLSGVTIRDRDGLRRAAEVLLRAGVRRVFISLGAQGVYAADGTGHLLLPAMPVLPVNTTGSGDAFTAGLVWALLRGADLEGSARAGLAAAAIALESEETVSPAMSARALLERLEDNSDREH